MLTQSSPWRVFHPIFYCKHGSGYSTIVKPIYNETGFFQFTMVNVIVVCRDSNGGRMKAKLTIVKRPEKAWFIARLSKLCLFK